MDRKFPVRMQATYAMLQLFYLSVYFGSKSCITWHSASFKEFSYATFNMPCNPLTELYMACYVAWLVENSKDATVSSCHQRYNS